MIIDVAVCLPQEAESVAIIREVVTNALRSFGVADDCVDDIRLALSEACTNVIDHASSGDEYEVQVHIDAERCVLDVKNVGDGFDAEALTDVMPDGASARGRGVAIMRAVMDAVHFSSEPERGTIVHLVKTLTVRQDGPLARLRARR